MMPDDDDMVNDDDVVSAPAHQERMDQQPISFPPIPETAVTEWEYDMRRSMQEIIPGLFLGPYAAAQRSKLDYLLANRITHIVCIREANNSTFVKPNFTDRFNYLVLNINDVVTENIIKHIKPMKAFVDNSLNNGGRVLVHGSAGISRSASLVIAYLMQTYGLTYSDAFTHVQQKRYCISPNDGFAKQLAEFEPMYRANLMQNGDTSTAEGLFKRKLDDNDDDDDLPREQTSMDYVQFATHGQTN